MTSKVKKLFYRAAVRNVDVSKSKRKRLMAQLKKVYKECKGITNVFCWQATWLCSKHTYYRGRLYKRSDHCMLWMSIPCGFREIFYNNAVDTIAGINSKILKQLPF
jgi:hypothetical protein